MSGLLVNNYSQRNPPTLGEAFTGLLGNWGDNIEQGLLSALPVLAENDPYKIGQQLLREGAGVGGIAWHGSPHKFARPDLSKIGTGEGAQAYGHGFYSAEARGVGEEYREQLSRNFDNAESRVALFKNDKEITLDDINSSALKDEIGRFQAAWDDDLSLSGRDIDIDEVFSNLRSDAKLEIEHPWASTDEIKAARALLKEINELDGSLDIRAVDQGYLYKMNIPDETIDKMLDWDKPLFQQSDQVKRILDNGSDPELIQKKIDALHSSLQKFDGDDDLLGLFTGTVKTPPINQKIYKEIERLTNEKLKAENLINRLAEFRKRDRDTRAYRQGSLKGKDFYNHLGGGEAASEYLNSLGIPGIKYLDGNSRAAGQGSRNFVSFTPDHIEMLERNGIPMKGLLGE